METKIYTAIGLMSGTSLDGVDAALIETDGQGVVRPKGFETYPYNDEVKDAVRLCFGKHMRDEQTAAAEALVTQAHIDAVKTFGQDADMIGFHGQSITHDPDSGFTWQIGDASALAQDSGIDVIADMRQADIQNGGQGAPLLPLYHRARAEKLPKSVAILNLGGVGNVTYLGAGKDELLAFDTGPGNALMDDFIFARTGTLYDKSGALAQAGQADEGLLEQWLAHPFFDKMPPKSLDRSPWDVSGIDDLRTEGGLATLAQFTIRSVLKSFAYFPGEIKALYVTGGGRHNTFIMNGLALGLNIPVAPVEALGWNGDALEAEGFAYLAVRSLLGLPLTLPQTTAVAFPTTGGVLYKAK